MSTTNLNPLDANKTIHTTTNNSSDEPNTKMAKLQTNVQQQEKAKKLSDKKKALKRLWTFDNTYIFIFFHFVYLDKQPTLPANHSTNPFTAKPSLWLPIFIFVQFIINE